MKSTTKKLLLGILLTVCLTVLLALCAGAEDVTYSEGLEFTSNWNGTCYVSGIGTCTDTEVVIPPVNSFGEPVVRIGNSAFKGCLSLTSVTIPESVTSIEMSAFHGCVNLTSVNIPDGITSILGYTFYGCKNLTNIVIPDSIADIARNAFSGCDELIQIENGVEYVDKWAVACATDVTEVTLRVDTEGIADSAFINCRSLTRINVPNSVKYINGSAFYNCISLTSINLPDGLTIIDSMTFCDCYSLANIEIPESVTNIGPDAFSGCEQLIQIENGIKYVQKWTIDCSTDVTKATLRADTVGIADSAFEGLDNLISVEIPNSVKYIGSFAFSYCTFLTSVEIPDSVKHIGSDAFCYCYSLTSVEIPNGVTHISSGLFDCCESLKSIRIPDSVTSIGVLAFGDCYSLESIEVPESVKSIEDAAFISCFNLTDVYFHGTEVQWDQIFFDLYNEDFRFANIHFLGDATVINNTEATCTEPGEITYECGCGSTHTFSQSALGHLWEGAKWYTFTSPTCMTAGEERIDCQRDGCDHYETKTIEIDSSAHSLEWTYDGDQHWQYCTNKNKEGVQCTHTTEKADHIPGEWITDPGKEATCTADGEKHTECTVCGAHKTEIISALGHDYIPHEAKDATCTEIGWNAYETCSRCPYTTYEAVPALDHDYIPHDPKAATCTEIGWNAYETCSRCDYTTYEEISALGHNRGEDGYCTRCGEIVYSEGLKFTSNGDGTCRLTGYGTCTDLVVYVPPVSPEGDRVESICYIGIDFAWNEELQDGWPLEAVIIPEGVTRIEANAFYACARNFCYIYVPSSVNYINPSAFGWDDGWFRGPSLEKVTISEENPYYAVVANSLIDKRLNAVIYGVGDGSVPEISADASNGDFIEEWNIPYGVKKIGDRAFQNVMDGGYAMASSTPLVLPDTLEYIGAYAFSSDRMLPYGILVPSSVTYVGEGAFSEMCYYYSNYMVSFMASVTKLSEYMFRNSNFGLVELSGTITHIGAYAFDGCNALTDVYFHGTEAMWNEITIDEGNDPLLNATIHFLGDAKVVSNTATCTEAGEITYECGCGSTHTFSQSALGHLWEGAKWYTFTSPTCMTAGEERRDCQRDGCDHYETKTIEIDSSAHSLEWTYAGDQHWQYCTNKNKEGMQCTHTTEKADHIPGEWITDPGKEATCTADGEKHTECTVCGAHMTEIISALGHDYIPHDPKTATCTEIGWNAYETCSRCDYTTYEEIPATDHTEAIDPAAAPTCTATGLTEGKHCSVCGEILVAQEIVPATDHSFTKYAHDSISHWLVCKNCDEEPENSVKQPHKLVWTVTDNTNEDEDKLSCTLRGQCACGYGKEESIITGTAKITGASLALGEKLTLKYYATLPAANMNVVMRFTYEGETYDVEGIKDAESGEYVFAFDRIPPSKMDAVVKAELVLIQNDTKIVLAVKDEYSISEYCKDAKQDNPDNSALNHLLNDLENYSKAAEDYENGVSKDPSDVAWEPVTDTDFSLTDPADETVRFISAGVRFGYINRLFFKFTAEDLNGLTVKVNDTLYTESDFTLVEGTENTYIIYSEGINATEFDKIFTAVLLVNGEEVQTLEYSIKSYVEAKQDDPEIGALVRSLYNYGKSSELYRDEM